MSRDCSAQTCPDDDAWGARAEAFPDNDAGVQTASLAEACPGVDVGNLGQRRFQVMRKEVKAD